MALGVEAGDRAGQADRGDGVVGGVEDGCGDTDDARDGLLELEGDPGLDDRVQLVLSEQGQG